MIIVNVLKIPNQIQFGLEQSLTIANALNLEPIPVLFCKTQIPNQMQIGLENFDDHC